MFPQQFPSKDSTAPGSRALGKAAQNGFALVVSMVLMGFILLLLVSLATLVQMETHKATSELKLKQARENALLGLMTALGELQSSLGPDQRASAIAAILDSDPETAQADGVGQPYWTGAWNASTWDRASTPSIDAGTGSTSNGRPNDFLRWLVSGEVTDVVQVGNAQSFDKTSPEAALLVGPGTLGDNLPVGSEEEVYAPKETIGTNGLLESHYAWWVGDEGVKARLVNATIDAPATNAEHYRANAASSRRNLAALTGWDALTTDASDDARLGDWMTVTAAFSDALGDEAVVQEKFHSLTPYSQGLLTDMNQGGFKKDLSLLFQSDTLPSGYADTPMFSINNAVGPTWDYVKRYHDRYKMIQLDGNGDPYIDILDVKPETLNSLGDDKPGDAPLPLIYRYQYVISLYKGYNTESGLKTTPLTDQQIADGVTNFESDDKIVYLMITPILYLWNPYNVSVLLPKDQHKEAVLNLFASFPHMEFSFDGGNSYKLLDDIFWFSGGTLIALQTSNEDYEEIIIPPGEIRINTLSKLDYNANLYMEHGERQDFWGTRAKSGARRNQPLSPGFDEGTRGLFSPTLLPGIEKSSPDTKLLAEGNAKIHVRFRQDPDEQFNFIIKFNIGAEGGQGNRQQAGTFHLKAPQTIDSEYLIEEFELGPSIALSSLTDLRDGESDNFTGLVPLFVINYELRAIPNNEGIGKPTLFWDYPNAYYYSESVDERAYALSPFKFSFEQVTDIDDLIFYDDFSGRVLFNSVHADISSNISNELLFAPISSVAQLEHAPLGRDYSHLIYDTIDFDNHNTRPGELPESDPRRRDMAPVFGLPVGNSFSHPMLPLAGVSDGGYGVDYSYFLNDVLFDSYLFTGLAEESGPLFSNTRTAQEQFEAVVAGEEPLTNAAFSLYRPIDLTDEEVVALFFEGGQPKAEAFERIAAYLTVDGAFNVNSTSADAWAALLSGLRDREVLYRDESGDLTLAANDERSPILSKSLPANIAAEEAGSNLDRVNSLWSGYRSLSDTQIRTLAEKLVEQVKARGPFLSLGQFVNREISDRTEFSTKGAVQAAIDEAGLNTTSDDTALDTVLKEQYASNTMDTNAISGAGFTSPQSMQGDRSEGAPGYITQASILKPVAPMLSARSDTFVIRSYGDVERNGVVEAKAWCEAVVQRQPDYVPGSSKESWELPDADSIEEKLGRGFKIVSFRWLDESEV